MTSVEAGPDAGPAFRVGDVAPDLGNDVALWLLRHGETEWSRSGQHTGVTDIPLTEAGERQAQAMAALIGDVSPALVLSSPRTRAQNTARLAGLTGVEVDDDLVEWDYGAYEGRTTEEIREQNPGWDLFTHGVPGGETLGQVTARADRVLARAARTLPEGPVVLVGHGHFSRVLGARWIGLAATGGANLMLGTAAPSLLGVYHGQPVIRHWNMPNPAAD